MKNVRIQVATHVEDLAGLPVGTRIATNFNKILELDEAWSRQYWIERGTLEPLYQPQPGWLPAYILPASTE
jgi:hypothetical protein